MPEKISTWSGSRLRPPMPYAISSSMECDQSVQIIPDPPRLMLECSVRVDLSRHAKLVPRSCRDPGRMLWPKSTA
jgi:hypothetical protein